MGKPNRASRVGLVTDTHSMANCASPGEAKQWPEEHSSFRKDRELLAELTGFMEKLNLAVRAQYLG